MPCPTASRFFGTYITGHRTISHYGSLSYHPVPVISAAAIRSQEAAQSQSECTVCRGGVSSSLSPPFTHSTILHLRISLVIWGVLSSRMAGTLDAADGTPTCITWPALIFWANARLNLSLFFLKGGNEFVRGALCH